MKYCLQKLVKLVANIKTTCLQEFVKLVLRLRFRGRVSVFPPVSTSCNQTNAIVHKTNKDEDHEVIDQQQEQ